MAERRSFFEFLIYHRHRSDEYGRVVRKLCRAHPRRRFTSDSIRDVMLRGNVRFSAAEVESINALVLSFHCGDETVDGGTVAA